MYESCSQNPKLDFFLVTKSTRNVNCKIIYKCCSTRIVGFISCRYAVMSSRRNVNYRTIYKYCSTRIVGFISCRYAVMSFYRHAQNGPLEFWRSLKRLGLEEVQVPLVCALAVQLLHSRSGWSLQSSNIENINKI